MCHHARGIPVQDLLLGVVADIGIFQCLAGPFVAEAGAVGAEQDRSAPYSRTPASMARGPNELQSTYTGERAKRTEGSSSSGVSSRQRWSMRSTS